MLTNKIRHALYVCSDNQVKKNPPKFSLHFTSACAWLPTPAAAVSLSLAPWLPPGEVQHEKQSMMNNYLTLI